MAEMDTLFVTNPLGVPFTIRFNGEPYVVPAEGKHYPQFLAFHIAKHLSDVPINLAIQKSQTKKDVQENPYNPAIAQMQVYDNPMRRIALYDILGSKALVQACIESYPFKSFIGEMSEYDDYVAKKEKKAEKVKDE